MLLLGAAVAVGGDVDVFVVIADAADTLACKKKYRAFSFAIFYHLPSHIRPTFIPTSF